MLSSTHSATVSRVPTTWLGPLLNTGTTEVNKSDETRRLLLMELSLSGAESDSKAARDQSVAGRAVSTRTQRGGQEELPRPAGPKGRAAERCRAAAVSRGEGGAGGWQERGCSSASGVQAEGASSSSCRRASGARRLFSGHRAQCFPSTGLPRDHLLHNGGSLLHRE